ncbi:hypothetical protein MAQ5080_00379 [Marinomonas aquimarina]|uniref:Uncharacterized protein n=1 Tax=Marinomonas aquimarina TaxID=295068 RepID=A0A1A8T1K2_9GAMM|nr:hypothetical protein MAQ5080_00379 [Marinomonas aquimarina]
MCLTIKTKNALLHVGTIVVLAVHAALLNDVSYPIRLAESLGFV